MKNLILITILTFLPLGAATVFAPGARRTGQRISAGADHVCTVRGGGQLRCWGRNNYGQLGDNTVTDQSTPIQIAGFTGALAVSAGVSHTCALRADGTVHCWGRNNDGRLGDNTYGDRRAPVPVSGLSGAIAIAAGQNHSCAVLAFGEVRCWGLNSLGQLGDGTAVTRPAPVTVTLSSGAPLTGAVDVAAGKLHTCALTFDARVFCWGSNSDGQVAALAGTPLLNRATEVIGAGSPVLLATGANHTCVVLANRQLRCWGDNASGQLGTGTYADQYVPVDALSGVQDVIGIAAGADHTCLLRASAAVECWGSNSFSQLGDGTQTPQTAPVTRVGQLSSITAAITTRSRHNCALLADDQVRCWGENAFGQLGDGTHTQRSSPVNALPAGLNLGKAITAGEITCAIRASGVPDCWGRNSSGQRGDAGGGINRITPDPASPVVGYSNALQIEAGWQATCSLHVGGNVKCWGANDEGQLGNGSNLGSTTPVAVSSVSGVVTLSGRWSHFCAVQKRGVVECWGRNTSGQLGNGVSGGSSNLPVQVTGLSNAVMVSAGASHTCALRVTGQVDCWGDNTWGQLGDGTWTSTTTPVPVSGLSDAVAIAAGGRHTCAVRVGGAVVCWGANNFGQLGDGTVSTRSVSASALGFASNAVDVAVGLDHSCALLSDGSAKCWGASTEGQIGYGSTIYLSTPRTVAGLPLLSSLSLGNQHTCVLAASGRPHCWGENGSGEMGDGTSGFDRLTPVAVLTF